jgi:uncharacterized protein YbaP (TraB family)
MTLLNAGDAGNGGYKMRHSCFAIRTRQICLLPLLLVFLFLPSLLPAGSDRQQGLLWEVAVPGQPPGYLFGTIHSGKPAVLALPEPVQRAFDASDSVVLEVLLDLDAMRYSGQVMLLDEGRLLSDIAGKELFEQTARAIRTRGIPEVVLERMKPWAAAVTLSMPAPEAGEVLDMELYQQALQAGKPVFGLESIHEQLAIFDDMPEQDQLVLLRDAVENFAQIEVMQRELIDAWLQRDLGTLLAINDAAMQAGDRQLAAEFQDRLIVRRNQLMVERLQQYLRAGKVFVAVGALHLPGETGLLNLLEQRGFTVRVIY